MSTFTVRFDQPNHSILDYSLGDQVTRENFVSFLVLSFAVSRGHPEIQKMFFMWIEKATKFPFVIILEDFVSNGAASTFSREEWDMFKDAFSKVKKHSDSFDPSEFDDELQDELRALHERLENKMIMETVLGFFDFDTIKSITEFNEASAKYIQIHKVKKN
jgi:uncharacterized Zn finger protein